MRKKQIKKPEQEYTIPGLNVGGKIVNAGNMNVFGIDLPKGIFTRKKKVKKGTA